MVADTPHPDERSSEAGDEPLDFDPGEPEKPHEDEPGTSRDASAAEGPSSPSPSEEFGPLELEEAEPAASHVEDLDVCPNCGAPMRGTDSLVCVRCGFDLKTLRVIEAAVEEPSDEEQAEEDEAPATPLVRPMLGDPLAPSLAAAISIGTLVIALLAGLEALFPAFDATQPEAMEVPWKMRLGEALRLPLFIGLWLACGFAALLVAAWLFGRPLGNGALALWRMLAVVSVAHLVVFFDIENSNWELFLEVIAHAVAFFVLIMMLYRLKPRDTATVLGVMVVLYGALWVLARAVVWATA